MPKPYTEEIAKKLFVENGFTPLEKYINCKTKIKCLGTDGFLYDITLDNVLQGKKGQKISAHNRYSIDNIKKMISDDTCCEYECISKEFVSAKDNVIILHKKCGNTFEAVWNKISNRINNPDCTVRSVKCPFCELKKTESTHALVLKQVWMHEHPDTNVEDGTCVNPNTNHVMPTDIVNHRLKISIEVQSWFHDFPDRKIRDKIKKDFWVNKGYTFYAIDQRDYTVLEMVQLFFPHIDKIPDYIDFNFPNKLNDIKVQQLLNEGKNVSEISKILNCKSHTIYDAIRYGRICYPEWYTKQYYTPVLQYDLNNNFISEYETIKAAEEATGCKGLSSMFYHGRNEKGGYLWYKKEKTT